MSFIIDTELAGYLPGVPSETDEALESQLRQYGVMSPFVVWKDKNILLDGHRRYGICKKLRLPVPDPIYLDFADKEAVKHWMRENQDCRRNMGGHELSMMRAESVKYLQSKGDKKSAAVRAVAEKEGVSTRTVQRDIEYAGQIDKVNDELRERITTGELKATHKDVAALAALTPEHQLAVAAQVDSGIYKTLSKALHGEEEASPEYLGPPAEPDSDTVSQKKKRPPSKPADSYLEDAQMLFAKGVNLLALANEAESGHAQYGSCQKILTNLSVVMTGWRDELKKGVKK